MYLDESYHTFTCMHFYCHQRWRYYIWPNGRQRKYTKELCGLVAGTFSRPLFRRWWGSSDQHKVVLQYNDALPNPIVQPNSYPSHIRCRAPAGGIWGNEEPVSSLFISLRVTCVEEIAESENACIPHMHACGGGGGGQGGGRSRGRGRGGTGDRDSTDDSWFSADSSASGSGMST